MPVPEKVCWAALHLLLVLIHINLIYDTPWQWNCSNDPQALISLLWLWSAYLICFLDLSLWLTLPRNLRGDTVIPILHSHPHIPALNLDFCKHCFEGYSLSRDVYIHFTKVK